MRLKKSILKLGQTFWFLVKALLYICLLLVFMYILGQDNRGLIHVSRTMGIVVMTFAIMEVIFVRTYGGFDIGRRKSKPIIFSLSFATFFTDVIVYLQTMIMRTNGVSVKDFRLFHIELLFLVMLVQLVVIIAFVYGANGIFFKFHKPEESIVITNSQESLNALISSVSNLKKQYAVTAAYHYRHPELEEKIRGAKNIFIASIPPEERSEIMRTAYRYQKNVYLAPEVEDIMEMSGKTYLIDDTIMMNYNSKAMTMEQRIAKRLLDIILSLTVAILTAPFIAIAMLLIKLEDGGPVFYRQERATIHGNVFYVLKLRTMKQNDNAHSATADDDRITKVGHFLRRSRLDEVPQVYNVLKGDMSFVGPRPEMLKNVEAYTKELPEFKYRLRMKAGLTGYAQIAGKYNTTPKDKLVLDMMYIEQYSVLLDLQLIFQTVIAVIRPDSSEGFHEIIGGNCLGIVLNKEGVEE